MTRLDSCRLVAEYRGRSLTVAFRDRGWVAVLDDGGAFPDALDRGRRDRDPAPWVKLPNGSVTSAHSHTVTASWRGERVLVDRVTGDQVEFSHVTNPRWAREQGLSGSQYEGMWWGRASRDELSDVVAQDQAVELS